MTTVERIKAAPLQKGGASPAPTWAEARRKPLRGRRRGLRRCGRASAGRTVRRAREFPRWQDRSSHRSCKRPWASAHRRRRGFALRLHGRRQRRSEEHTSELQSRRELVCRLLLEKKKVIRGQDLRSHPEG